MSHTEAQIREAALALLESLADNDAFHDEVRHMLTAHAEDSGIEPDLRSEALTWIDVRAVLDPMPPAKPLPPECIDVGEVECPQCDCNSLRLMAGNGQGGYTDIETEDMPLAPYAMKNHEILIACGACGFESDDARISESRNTEALQQALQAIHREQEAKA